MDEVKDLAAAGGPDPSGGEERPMPIRTRWVRERMRIPDLERLLSEPAGARLGDNFDSLRVRVAKAVDRIAETARSTSEEIRRRSQFLALASLSSAAIGIVAIFVSLYVREYSLPAGLIGMAELVAVLVLRTFHRRLASDLLAVGDLEVRFREDLEAARTPEDLSRLGERIRAEMAQALDSRS